MPIPRAKKWIVALVALPLAIVCGAYIPQLAQVLDLAADLGGAINEVYATFFNGAYPARSCVEVARLPKDVMLEVEAIAVK